MSHRDSSNPPADRATRHHRWGHVVYLLFFLSGLTSLIYEVIWVRQFGLLFGITTYAVSTVLAAFFAGLALGSYIAGRAIDRTRLHPLVVYGAMEGVIGLYALLLPTLLKLVEAAYPFVYTSLAESFSLFTLFRFVMCFALLAIPTTLMGATLPVLSKLMVDREDALGLSVGRLYSINTFGAVAGTVGAGFILIPTFGVSFSTLVAALGNFLLAVVAIIMSGLSVFALAAARPADQPSDEARPQRLNRTERIILFLAFTSGFAALALEVVWMRTLVLVLGSTTYAFSTMLAAVLVGIALGSAVFARFADPTRNRAGVVAFLFYFGGFCAVLGPAIINRLPYTFLKLYDWTYGVWGLVLVAQFIVCFILVLVPTFLFAASFPILVRMYSRGVANVGRTVADVYSINTFGGILGSLVGGFVLVKFLGLQRSLTVSALYLMVVGGPLAMALAKPLRRPARWGIAALMVAGVVALALAPPRFDSKLLFAGWGPYAGGYYVGRMSQSTVDVTDRHMQRVLYHKEGVTASVDVLETGWGYKIISINAKPVATTYLYDMRALKMLGHLPVLLHPQPEKVLIIGLGAGVSSGIIATYPSVQEVTVVELCEEVPDGTAHFADWNYDVLENDKVTIVINDGANYIKATRSQYDVISSDPIHPFVSGAGTLYSYEHWQACKDRLRDGGILAQWLPLYHLSSEDFATIVRTFVDVFPNATMWFSGIDTVLIGSKGPFEIDLDRLAQHMSAPIVRDDLFSMGVERPGDVLGWFVAGPEQLREMGGQAPRNSVDLPVIEFNAPKALSLAGVSATMPALLTAVEQVSPYEARKQISSMCTVAPQAQTLQDADTGRRASEWLMRGQLLYSYDYGQQCLNAVSRAHSLRPRDRFIRRALADAQYAVGNTNLADGYPQEAFETFREAHANDPQYVGALTGGVRAALNMSNVNLAEETLRWAAPEQRSIFQVLSYSGLVALQRLDYDRARDAFEEAASRGQESPTMHIGLGIVELKRDRTESAHRHFRRALEIATDPGDALFNIVDSCTYHDVAHQARPYAGLLVSAASVAIADDPGNPALYTRRALAYRTLGDDTSAARDEAAARSLSGWW